LLLYVVFSQLWLNVLVNDCQFFYIKNLKKKTHWLKPSKMTSFSNVWFLFHFLAKFCQLIKKAGPDRYDQKCQHPPPCPRKKTLLEIWKHNTTMVYGLWLVNQESFSLKGASCHTSVSTINLLGKHHWRIHN